MLDKRKCLTLDADNMLANLLLNQGIWDGLDQIVDGVDAGMNTLEALYFLPDGLRVCYVRLHVSSSVHVRFRRLLYNPRHKHFLTVKF